MTARERIVARTKETEPETKPERNAGGPAYGDVPNWVRGRGSDRTQNRQPTRGEHLAACFVPAIS